MSLSISNVCSESGKVASRRLHEGAVVHVYNPSTQEAEEEEEDGEFEASLSIQ